MSDQSLHPAWFNHEPGKPITDLSLADTLDEHSRNLKCFGELLNQEPIEISGENLRQLGWMFTQMGRECETLAEAIKVKDKPSFRTIDGGES